MKQIMYLCIYKHKNTINNSNMSETITVETPTRRNVDIREYLIPIEKAAIEDAVVSGSLTNVAEYTREILSQFIRIRDYHRTHRLPLLTPAEVADIIISSKKQNTI